MMYYGLILFLVLEYLRPGSYVPGLDALHLNSIVPIAVLVGSLFTQKVKISRVLASPNARWIMFLLSLMVISGLTCDVKLYALDKFTAVLGYFFMFVIVKKEINDIDRIKGVFKALIFVHLAIGALTPGLFSGDGERHYIAAGSFLGDGNDFALSVTIVIPFCLFMLSQSQTFTHKVYYSCCLVLLVIAVVATQSRGAMVALTCMALYSWAESDRKMLGVVVIMITVTVIMSVAPAQFFQRMESMTKTGDEMEGSAQGRILAWKSAIRMAVDHPLLGVGLGHFPVKFGAEYPPEGYRNNEIPWITAHSSYFLILGELGIPGITFLVVMISSNLLAGERMLLGRKHRLAGSENSGRSLVIALNAGLISFMVGGAFISAAYYPHIYLLAALLECGRDIFRSSQVNEATVKSPEKGISQVHGIDDPAALNCYARRS